MLICLTLYIYIIYVVYYKNNTLRLSHDISLLSDVEHRVVPVCLVPVGLRLQGHLRPPCDVRRRVIKVRACVGPR